MESRTVSLSPGSRAGSESGTRSIKNDGQPTISDWTKLWHDRCAAVARSRTSAGSQARQSLTMTSAGSESVRNVNSPVRAKTRPTETLSSMVGTFKAASALKSTCKAPFSNKLPGPIIRPSAI